MLLIVFVFVFVVFVFPLVSIVNYRCVCERYSWEVLMKSSFYLG